METIVFLVLMYWLFSKGKKKSSKKQKQTRRSLNDEIAKWIEKSMQAQKTAGQSKARMEDAVPAAAVESIGEGQSQMAFTQDVHGHTSQKEEYMGSLNADTSEGEDACDPALEHERPSPISAQTVYDNEIGAEPLLDLSAKGLYQGLVMSEILRRPSERGHRRY